MLIRIHSKGRRGMYDNKYTLCECVCVHIVYTVLYYIQLVN